jgi:hypothetical protein
VLVQVLEASARVEAVVGSLAPDVLDPSVASDYVEAFAKLERLAAAGKALAARRVAATGAWKRDGARDAAGWLAKKSGTSVGHAARDLDTAARAADLPATDAALRAGELSAAQAALIADAAAADPHSERELLERAGRDGLSGLRTQCARVKAAAREDEMDHYERIHDARSLRAFTDDEGAGRIEIRGPVDATAKIMAAIRPIEQELFEIACASGGRVRSEAVAFDALVAFVERAGSVSPGADEPGNPSPATVNVRVDFPALVRGHTEPGEVCEIAGVGPVPVAVVSQMLDHAILRVIVVDGADVVSVSHPGRFVGARMRTAVEELFAECAIEGCHLTEHLEIDHNQPVEAGGPSALWNLSRLCRHHHRHKHRHDLRLVGTGTDRRFVPAREWRPPGPAP